MIATKKTTQSASRKPRAPAPKETLLHEKDFFKWTRKQAACLKKQEFSNLDIENLIEEIESLGRSERRTLESYLEVMLMHMLKVKSQPQRHSKSWDLSIKNSRQKFKKVLKQSPSLKSKFAEILKDAYASARLDAALETGLDEKVFPINCPWTMDQILSEES